MIERAAPAAHGPQDPQNDEARLRQATRQLEGVFLEYLFRAMRETVPQDGILESGSGEEIFNSMFDQQIADSAAAKQENGLGEALYRQLAARLRQMKPAEGSE